MTAVKEDPAKQRRIAKMERERELQQEVKRAEESRKSEAALRAEAQKKALAEKRAAAAARASARSGFDDDRIIVSEDVKDTENAPKTTTTRTIEHGSRNDWRASGVTITTQGDTPPEPPREEPKAAPPAPVPEPVPVAASPAPAKTTKVETWERPAPETGPKRIVKQEYEEYTVGCMCTIL